MTGQDFRGLGQNLRLVTLRYLWVAIAWLVPLWAFFAVSAPSYQSIYPDPAMLELIVTQAQDSPAMTMLLGELASPGTLGQVLVWKVGAYALWCAAIMGIIHTSRLARADESNGLTETLRAFGAGRRTPFMSASIYMFGLVGALAVGIGVTLSVSAISIEALDHTGAWAFAGVVAVVGWTFVGVALVTAQLFSDPGTVRGVALMIFAGQWAIRIIGVEADILWLRWLSPLGWRDLVDPYGQNRLLPLVVGLLSALALVGAAYVLHDRREFLSGALPEGSHRTRRWTVRSQFGLRWRLGLRNLAWWALTVAGIGAFFGSMTGSMTQILEDSPETLAIFEAMGGSSDDMVALFMQMLTLIMAPLALIATVQRATWLSTEEANGFVELSMAQGTSRARVYWSHIWDVCLFGTLMVVGAATGLAAATSTQLTEGHAVERAVVYTVSQAPGVLAAVGITAVLVGMLPRRVAVTWLPVAWSAVVAYAGELLRLPDWALDITYLGHTLDVVDAPTAQDWLPLMILTGVGVVGIGVGAVAFGRRDLGKG